MLPIRIGVLSDDRARHPGQDRRAEELVKAVRLVRTGARQDYGHRLDFSAVAAAELHRFVVRFVASIADAADIAQQTCWPARSSARVAARISRRGCLRSRAI